jgi:predicted DNA-binding transcriptional regulator YafY
MDSCQLIRKETKMGVVYLKRSLVVVAHLLGADAPDLIACEIPSRLTKPGLDTLACVTRAIHQERPLKVTYHSLSNGETEREIVPFALIDNGLR